MKKIILLGILCLFLVACNNMVNVESAAMRASDFYDIDLETMSTDYTKLPAPGISSTQTGEEGSYGYSVEGSEEGIQGAGGKSISSIQGELPAPGEGDLPGYGKKVSPGSDN